jgi:signal transduction histidine kinase
LDPIIVDNLEGFSRGTIEIPSWEIHMKTLMDLLLDILQNFLANFIKYFRDSQKFWFMLHVVQEKADFKNSIKLYILPLEGIKDMHIFCFFLDRTSWLLF